MRPYIDMTDEELVQMIKDLFAAKLEVSTSGVAVVQGEGRRLEYTQANISQCDILLRHLGFEARTRGLAIGGSGGGAIAVEFGHD